MLESCGLRLILGLIFAGFAARVAVIKAVFAETDVQLTLAQAAVFFALAALLAHFTLGAAEFRICGGHAKTVLRQSSAGKCRR